MQEKDLQLNNLKNQVKHLTVELNRRREETQSQVSQMRDRNANPDVSEDMVAMARDLEAAREMVRSLNSQNSELRLIIKLVKPKLILSSTDLSSRCCPATLENVRRREVTAAPLVAVT